MIHELILVCYTICGVCFNTKILVLYLFKKPPPRRPRGVLRCWGELDAFRGRAGVWQPPGLVPMGAGSCSMQEWKTRGSGKRIKVGFVLAKRVRASPF